VAERVSGTAFVSRHKIIVKKGREKSLRRRHPWLFSGAIYKVEGTPGPGDTVDVVAADGSFLARGAYSGRSQIRVRIWSFDPAQEVSPEFFKMRLTAAVQLRNSLGLLDPRGACRVVYGESDGLPGLIVDRYAEYLVCQFLTRGAVKWKDEIVAGLQERLPAAGIYERSDPDVRSKEGLDPFRGLISGREPPERILIEEGPCRFAVDIRHGQKTGFYLDQRENRRVLLEFARNAEVLNSFAYTGGFGISALQGGAARVTHIDSSPDALDLARYNTHLNGLGPEKAEYREGNVFQVLREYRDSGRRFDLVILDPPRFVESMKNLEPGSRGYKDINMLAFRLLRPGGVLFTFSCSGLMPTDLFQKIVADAALDAGTTALIIRRLAQASDHPTALSFPEAGYLKGLVCRVL
jgi:23S rRNA (cytosine1962-C5)-methyltransferase